MLSILTTRELQIIIKTILDRIGAIVLLLLLAPIFCVIGFLIRVSDGGPVFFHQKRLGKASSEFKIWKFRTMVVDADRFLNENGVASQPRITRIGRFLRRYSLDEIPQLINILKGEMSFIGPRPALVEHKTRYTKEQMCRLEMLPGVTGLAQVNGRNTLKWSRRIEYDIEYIENYSLFLDLKILLRTIVVVLLRQGVVLDRNADKVDDLGK